MILNRFFKPKWQHPNAQIRKQALQELTVSDPALVQAAREDQDPEVRLAALARISELDLLQDSAGQDSDARVRELADTRFRELLSGKTPASPPLDVRLSALVSLTPSHIEFLARHAVEPELRLAALQRLASEALIKEIVLHDTAVEVRLAALERIRTNAELEIIVKQSRNRDKRIYRRARERLDSLRAEQARAGRIIQLCEEMEALTWDGEMGRHAARYPKLEKEWQEVAAWAEPETSQRYQQSRTRFLAARQQSVARRTTRQELCNSLESFLKTLQDREELTPELAAAMAQTVQEAQREWEQCGPVEDIEGQRLEQRFLQLERTLRERERVLHRNQERANRLRRILQQADTLLHQPSEVLQTEIMALRQEWTGLERPESRLLAAHLQADFDTVLGRLNERLKRQVEQRDEEWKELQELVQGVEKALNEGTLQQALQLREQARKRLKTNIGLSRKQMMTLDERLNACMPRLGELRDWRRWGTNQAREHLCEDAESLIGLTADSVAIARSIKELRQAWKMLDGSEGGAPRSLWRRFDRACERAYEPCQAYFDAQSREREQHRQQKEALCERLEQFEAVTDWDEVDWREADRLWREARKEWRKFGPVNRADRKNLEKRFNDALKRLDAHLKGERTRELHRRENLIQQVEALVQSEDLAAAIKGAKQAQLDWQPTVQATRREEQALWQRFRVACDAVFERREAEQQAAEQERQSNLDRKTALCEEVETLAGVDREGIVQARVRMREIQQEWGTLGPVPKNLYKAIERRFETACERLNSREEVLKQLQVREMLNGLRERAHLCAQVEACLVGENPDQAVAERARQAWKELTPLKTPVADAMRRRFNTACQAVTEGGEVRRSLVQELEGHLGRKQALCLQFEVLLGVDSPPEFAQARMEYQVARLSKSLNDRNGALSPAEIRQEAQTIEQQWYQLGLLPPAQNTDLEARFERALAASGGQGREK